MKTEELTALGLTEEQIQKVFAMNGKDVEAAKKGLSGIEAERDSLKERLTAAETTLKSFEGIDPAKINAEIETYKKRAEDAETEYTRKITERDQTDWITRKLDEYGVTSPYARKQLTTECMSSDSGLKWKDGGFYGFDEYMKAAKEQDSTLYQTPEEKAAAEQASLRQQRAPAFTTPVTPPNEPSASEKAQKFKLF